MIPRIRQEYDSENPDYYHLFGLTPSLDEAPLDEESQARLMKQGNEYVEIIRGSNHEDKEKLSQCKRMWA